MGYVSSIDVQKCGAEPKAPVVGGIKILVRLRHIIRHIVASGISQLPSRASSYPCRSKLNIETGIIVDTKIKNRPISLTRRMPMSMTASARLDCGRNARHRSVVA